MCDDLPFTHEFPYHTDSDTTPEYPVERGVARRNHFAAVAHHVSQKVGLAAQGASDGIDDLLHDPRGQSASLRNIKDRKEEHVGDGDEAACAGVGIGTAARRDGCARIYGFSQPRSATEGSGRTHPFSVPTVGWGLFRVSKIKGYQPLS